MLKSKSQIPNPPDEQVGIPKLHKTSCYIRDKSQINSNAGLEFPMRVWNLVLVICGLFVIWNLVLGIYSAFTEEQFAYDSKGRRDPFIPLVTSDGMLLKLDKEEVKGGLSLEGIIYDKHGLSYAIVNGEIVRISDTIGSYQILKIEENKVVFIKEGQIMEVELKREEE